MDHLYGVLARYFSGEFSSEDHLLVERFKKEHPREFESLKTIWNSDTPIEIHDFDVRKAWHSFEQKSNHYRRRPSRVFSMYSRFKQVAAVLILLILGYSSYLYFNSEGQMKREDIVHLSVSEKGPLQEVQLSDGTVVWIQRGGSISYPEVFEGGMREVQLEGQAFFEVTKNPSKPFVITTPNSSVTVLGTSFNVNSESGKTEVTVQTGKVKVETKKTKKYVVVLPDQTAVSTENEVVSFHTKDKNYLSWKTGVFEFKEEPVFKVIQKLNYYYSDVFYCKDSSIDCRFTGKFNRAEVDDVMDVLKLSCSFKVQKQKNHYIISSKE